MKKNKKNFERKHKDSTMAPVETPKGMVATNAVDPAVPASVWGYKGCAGKGMPQTHNAYIGESVFDRELKEYHASLAKQAAAEAQAS